MEAGSSPWYLIEISKSATNNKARFSLYTLLMTKKVWWKASTSRNFWTCNVNIYILLLLYTIITFKHKTKTVQKYQICKLYVCKGEQTRILALLSRSEKWKIFHLVPAVRRSGHVPPLPSIWISEICIWKKSIMVYVDNQCKCSFSIISHNLPFFITCYFCWVDVKLKNIKRWRWC